MTIFSWKWTQTLTWKWTETQKFGDTHWGGCGSGLGLDSASCYWKDAGLIPLLMLTGTDMKTQIWTQLTL